jgi:hypothetical protein
MIANVRRACAFFLGWYFIAHAVGRLLPVALGLIEPNWPILLFGVVLGLVFSIPTLIRIKPSRWAGEIGWWVALVWAATFLMWASYFNSTFFPPLRPLADELGGEFLGAAILSLMLFLGCAVGNPARIKIALRGLLG